MKNKNMKAASPAHALILACVALASCQLAIANPENPDDDPTLSAIHAKREPRHQIDLSNVHHDPPGGALSLAGEYPRISRRDRGSQVLPCFQGNPAPVQQPFSERPDDGGKGRRTFGRKPALAPFGVPSIPDSLLDALRRSGVLHDTNQRPLADAAGEILAVARNLKAVVDDMDRVIIPDYKWYLRDSGIPGIGERYYYYNGHIALDPEGIYHFMRMDRIADVHECINSE